MAIIGELFKIEKLLSSYDLKVIFDYLKEAANESSIIHKRIFSNPVGAFERHILAEDIIALEQVYYTKERAHCFVESHRKYIDFQLHLDGIEQMETVDIDRLVVKENYDQGKDLITYKMIDDSSKIVMRKNNLSIYFPEDAHVGLPMYNGKPSLVYKTVVKLPIENFYV